MICIIDCGTSYLDIFRARLRESGCTFEIVGIKDLDGHDFSPFSGLIITGAPMLLTQVNLQEHLRPFQPLKEAGVPILGICNGHQILGLLYGSGISIGARVEKEESIEFLEKDALFAGLESGSMFHESHSEHITLPGGFKLLAKSGSCENEAMKHEKKPIYGTQFHPEASGNNGKIILKNFAEMCLR